MTALAQRFRRDASLIFALGFGLFLTLALLSFEPTDPSFNSTGISGMVQNWCGYFGSFISDLILQTFGLTSWLLIGAWFYLCVCAFKRRDLKNSLVRIPWAIFLIISVSSLMALLLPEVRIYKNAIYLGGIIGLFISHQLVQVFNKVGAFIILTSITLTLAVIFLQISLEEMLRAIQPFFSRLKGFFQTKISSCVSYYKNKRAEKKSAPKIESFENKKAVSSPSPLFKLHDNSSMPTMEESPSSIEYKKEESTSESMDQVHQHVEVDLSPRKRLKAPKVERWVENWELPKLSLLQDPPVSRAKIDEKELRLTTQTLEDKLSQFSVNGQVVAVRPGPAVTMFEFRPNADVKISKITELADDLALALSSESIRIIAPVPGRDVVGIETSNSIREKVYLKDVLSEPSFWDEKIKLPVTLGKQVNGQPKTVDLRKMPHLLVAGTTGSGKSVFVVSVLTSLLFRHSPKTLKLILIDPKQVDLAAFKNIPHLLMPPIQEPKKAVNALKWAIAEMDKRYRSMSKFGARGLEEFNQLAESFSKTQKEEFQRENEEFEVGAKHKNYYYEPQPYIVVVVEEFGDLMSVDKVNVEQAVVRLAQMARACGIHLVLAMQSPRRDVVTGLIKTNIPGRISFKVAGKMDSRIILDEGGAERLLANGDMLFLAPGVAKPERHHGAWVSEEEISRVTQYWSDQATPQFDSNIMNAIEGSNKEGAYYDDDFEELSPESEDRYDEILAYVAQQKEISASLLQRKFRLGYPRAARMIEIFEKEGVVGPANGSKPRQVLLNRGA